MLSEQQLIKILRAHAGCSVETMAGAIDCAQKILLLRDAAEQRIRDSAKEHQARAKENQETIETYSRRLEEIYSKKADALEQKKRAEIKRHKDTMSVLECAERKTRDY